MKGFLFMYDIVVIGGGPAGLTAALYARRQNKSVLLIEKSSFGGQTVFSPKIENYPGFSEMSGVEFSDKLVDQVLNQGAELIMEEVINVINLPNNIKKVVTDCNEYEARAVIIATGAKHRLLGLENEENLIGSGISFCAVCDGAFFSQKKVAVVGGGNSALQEAILLSEICTSVYIIQNLPHMTGEDKLVKILESKPNVTMMFNSSISKITGNDDLEKITVHNSKTERDEELVIDGLFIAIGLVPDNDPVKDLIKLDNNGYIMSAEDTYTSENGIFAAGDCRTKNVRQITTAVADGAVAALSACKYLEL